MAADPFNKAHFRSLPEPPFRGDSKLSMRANPPSPYLDGLEVYIGNLHDHIVSIQEDERKLLKDYSIKVANYANKRKNERTISAEKETNDTFDSKWKLIRDNRKQYRELMWDAWNERRKLLSSMRNQKIDEDDIRRRLQLLSGMDKDPAENPKKLLQIDLFSIVFIILQIITIVLFVIGTDYDDDDDYARNNGTANRLADFHSFYMSIALFVVVGFGLIYGFMKKYSYSGLGFTFLLAIFAFEWTILTRIFFDNADDVNGTDEDWERGSLTIWMIINGMYGATAVLVTFGALLGRLKPFELILIVFLEVVAYNLNFYVSVLVLNAVDFSGPVTIFVFGAVFGLTISYILSLPIIEGEDDETFQARDRLRSYNSSIFALLGGAIMISTIAGFNTALGDDGTQYRIAINSVLAITAAIVMTFIASRLFWGKFNVMDVQRAPVAGAIAVAGATSYVVNPAGAMFIGGVVAFFAVGAYAFVTPFLEGNRTRSKSKWKFLTLEDTGGVLAYFLIPAVLGAVAGIIGTAISGNDADIWGNSTERIFVETDNQAGYQLAALAITIGIAFVGGLITGAILFGLQSAWKVALDRLLLVSYYSDEGQWVVPTDFERTQHKAKPAYAEEGTSTVVEPAGDDEDTDDDDL
eukprot:TRINITY_DN19808_c0_g1_i1.p1 TRINITY_DN19808_c0_g1~~TRINITY_DN19808_c0_g1_i1.p1  ORF type:complete len:652 (-),score=101.34 TRINITY_DN19808_c0_g1_i1:33-1946(-)